jgi:hypothetical protein
MSQFEPVQQIETGQKNSSRLRRPMELITRDITSPAAPAQGPGATNAAQPSPAVDEAQAGEARGLLWSDERGGHTLEWTLLLAVIGIPSYVVITMLLSALAGHYRMMTFVNSLPFP